MEENGLQNAMENSQMDSETKMKIEQNCLGPENDEVTNTAKDISILFFSENLDIIDENQQYKQYQTSFCDSKKSKIEFFFCFQIHGKFILSGTDKEISWNLVHDSKRSQNHHSLNFHDREEPNTFSKRFFREI